MRDGSATDRQLRSALHKEVPFMSPLRKIATLGTAAVVALMLLAAPASAKKPPSADAFSYIAQIDCGSGPVQVGSTDDLWAPLVDLRTGKKYKPIAWEVSGEGFSVDVAIAEPKKHSVACSYDDGVATGTVTVKKA
jgi:hypothetical protein